MKVTVAVLKLNKFVWWILLCNNLPQRNIFLLLNYFHSVQERKENVKKILQGIIHTEANYTYPFHVLEIVLIPNILQSLSATSAHETWLRNASNDHSHNTRILNFAEGGDIPVWNARNEKAKRRGKWVRENNDVIQGALLLSRSKV